MNNVQLSEANIKATFITPAILNVAWEENSQIAREYSFTVGRVIVRGKLLFYQQ